MLRQSTADGSEVSIAALAAGVCARLSSSRSSRLGSSPPGLYPSLSLRPASSSLVRLFSAASHRPLPAWIASLMALRSIGMTTPRLRCVATLVTQRDSDATRDYLYGDQHPVGAGIVALPRLFEHQLDPRARRSLRSQRHDPGPAAPDLGGGGMYIFAGHQVEPVAD